MRREDYLSNDYTKEDKRLIQIFREEVKKLDLLYFRAIESNDINKSKELLNKIKSISKILEDSYNTRADSEIPREYVKWATYIDDSFSWNDTLWVVLKWSEKDIYRRLESLWPLHVEAVNALLNTSKNYVKSSLDWMNRQAMTMITELQGEKVREELARWTIQWESMYEMKDRVRDYFQSNKISWFKDRSGKLWSLDRYVDMLTRTETSIANIQWTINRAIQLWHTKFRIIEAFDCCSYCADMNWDVVDISQWSVDLPPFHPNCRWYIIVVNDEWKDVNQAREDDIQNVQAITPQQKMEKSLDIVENSTMYLNKEQAVIVDIWTWEIERMASWTSRSVKLYRWDISKPYVFTHNHPNSSSLSKADLDRWFENDSEYWLRASSKVWTYSLYAERKIDKLLFLKKYDNFNSLATKKADEDMKSFANYWASWTTNDYIEFKDWTKIFQKEDPLKVDKLFDEHLWKYHREALKKASDDTPWVRFEYIENDWIQKDTRLNKMYLNQLKDVDKARRSRNNKKLYETKENIEINKYL